VVECWFVEKFARYKGKDLPLERIVQLKDSLTREIADFTVTFVLDQRVAGSGTLLRAGNNFGILTATHVAELFTGRNAKSVGLVISQHKHQFVLSPDYLIPIKIFDCTVISPDAGPDMTFLRIVKPDDEANIVRFKSAYRLEGRSFGQFSGVPIGELPWWIAGAPAEMSASDGERGTSSHVLTALQWVGEATMVSIDSLSDFDLVRLRISAGQHNFPLDYGGVSGGGIWVSAFAIDPEKGFETISYDPPFLAGVAFYQSASSEGERIIVGHGPSSIYDGVLSRLKKEHG